MDSGLGEITKEKISEGGKGFNAPEIEFQEYKVMILTLYTQQSYFIVEFAVSIRPLIHMRLKEQGK